MTVTESAADEPRTRPPFSYWRLGALVGAIIGALHLPAFTTGVWDNDETYIATVSSVLSSGGRLYADIIDRKPPLVFFLYQGTFFVTGSRALWGPRVLGWICLAASAMGCAVLARRRFGDRAGWIAGVLGALTTATLFPRDAQAANFEVFMLPGIVFSMVLADRKRPGPAGLVLGVAALAKQTALTTLLPLTQMAWTGHRIRGVLVLVLGTALPIVAAALVFGPHDFVFWVFTGNEGYLDPGGAWGLVLARMAATAGVFLLLNLPLVLALPRAARLGKNVDLWLWLASGLIGASAGLRFWGHYYWQVLPPLVVLAAGGIVAMRRSFAIAVVAATTTIAVVASLAALLVPSVASPRFYEPVASYVEANTQPGDRIFIWGHLSEVYWAADRLPATEIVTTGFLTGHTGGRPKDHVGVKYAVPGVWDDVMDELDRNPPAMILVMTDSDIRSADTYPPENFPRFEEFLRDHYTKVNRVNPVDVYVPN